MRNIYLCENTAEGIFSAIYRAYEDRRGHRNNEIQVKEEDFNRQLFCEYIPVATDFERAVKVARTVQRDVSGQAYEFLHKVSVSYRTDKADAMYRLIIEGLYMGNKALQHLTAPHMQILCDIEKHVDNEICHFVQFLRFEELENEALFARINPKNAILPYMADHFADRFYEEKWIIADTVHRTVLIHDKGEAVIYAAMEDVNPDELQLSYSEEEEAMQKLWKVFVDKIAIKERVNPNLQRQLLPLRFRKYMKEFNEG